MINQQKKTTIIVTVSVIVGVAAFTYGALTAPQSTQKQVTTIAMQTSPKPLSTSKPTKQQLQQQLTNELPTITAALTVAYPKILTDYIINKGQLFDNGQWFGTTLSYRGTDTLNRDTLRVLMQKKSGVWTLRTMPPQPILSTKQYPDVPRAILQIINQPISLP